MWKIKLLAVLLFMALVSLIGLARSAKADWIPIFFDPNPGGGEKGFSSCTPNTEDCNSAGLQPGWLDCTGPNGCPGGSDCVGGECTGRGGGGYGAGAANCRQRELDECLTSGWCWYCGGDCPAGKGCGSCTEGDDCQDDGCSCLCLVAAPTISGITQLSPTSAKIDYTAANNQEDITKYLYLFVGADADEVSAGCPGNAGRTACVASTMVDVPRGSTTTWYTSECESYYFKPLDEWKTRCWEVPHTTYNPPPTYSYTLSNLQAGTVYYWLLVADGSGGCYQSDSTRYLSSCSLLPNPVEAGSGPVTVTSQINPSAEISRVDYSGTANFSLDPASDTAHAYQTTVTGIDQAAGDLLTANVYFSGRSDAVCTATALVNADVSAAAWWQVADGSVHAGGNLFSAIPASCGGACEPSLLTGVSGLASFLGTISVGQGSLSQDGSDWNAQTVYQGTQTGFAYFKRLLQDDPAGIGQWDGSLPDANGVYLAENSVTTGGAWSVGNSEKIVLLVDGDVNINTNIDVATGGFLALIASGDIRLADGVSNVEGVFISDGTISSGGGSQPLTAEGIFTGWDGVSLGRDLEDGNASAPAEVFVYRPDLQLNAYRYLLWLSIDWREVAP